MAGARHPPELWVSYMVVVIVRVICPYLLAVCGILIASAFSFDFSLVRVIHVRNSLALEMEVRIGNVRNAVEMVLCVLL